MRPRTKDTVLYACKKDVDEALAMPMEDNNCVILFARKAPFPWDDFYTLYVGNTVIEKVGS